MKRLGELVVRWKRVVVALGVLFVVLAGVVGGGVASELSNGGFDDPGAESTVTAERLDAEFGVSNPAIVLVATALNGDPDSPDVVEAGLALTAALAAEPGVTQAASYWTLGGPPSLRSADGDRVLVVASVDGEQGEVLDKSGELAEAYRGERGPLQVGVGGPGPLFAEVQETIEADLTRAELIAFPVTAVLLVVIFGSVVAAGLPLLVGALAILSTLAILLVLTWFTEVSIFALNLTTALGLGLAIDYSLFVVSRYREELQSTEAVGEAVVRTVMTAGRTVLFSAGTVAASLAAMLVFDLAFLRSFGYAGIAVVAMAAVGAVVVLPALLAMLGHRVEALRVRRVATGAAGGGGWHRLATAVMRRPLPIALSAIALLLVLGAPFLRLNPGSSDDRVLPPTAAAREAGDVLRAEFDAFESSPIQIVTDAALDAAALDGYAARVSSVPGVARVDAATGSYAAGSRIVPPGLAHAGYASTAGGSYLVAILDVDPLSAEAEQAVTAIRALDDTPAGLAGVTAEFVDTKASLLGSLPAMIAIIAVVTFVLLFLMFGSIVVPAKAVVLNVLSLSATFGALVWVFQDGNLAGVLGFTPTGSLDLSMPILIFAIAFGLSMDYEVFLLSRIKEEWDRTGDNIGSVAAGLEKTGRIVTAAALLIAVVFVAFATSGVTMIKMFGIGMTLAVLVDAFIVRATLVPAFMRLAGNANWWAPGWMRRLHDRFGISESVDLESPPRLEPAVHEV